MSRCVQIFLQKTGGTRNSPVVHHLITYYSNVSKVNRVFFSLYGEYVVSFPLANGGFHPFVTTDCDFLFLTSAYVRNL